MHLKVFCTSSDFDFDLQDLGKDWIPKCLPASKPFLDQRFNNLDEDFFFYTHYGGLSEFDVRLSTERSDKARNTTTKYFVGCR